MAKGTTGFYLLTMHGATWSNRVGKLAPQVRRNLNLKQKESIANLLNSHTLFFLYKKTGEGAVGIRISCRENRLKF